MNDNASIIVPSNKITDVIITAYAAKVNAIFEGPTGIGKTCIIMETKQKLEEIYHGKIDIIVINCLELEPQDILGLPYRTAENTTGYAAPAFLPQSGNGIILFEEINRAPELIRALLLSLLTHRKITESGYILPEGYIFICTMNPAEDSSGKQYFVDELDPAFRDRFLFVRTGFPEKSAWLQWAKANGLHETIVSMAASFNTEEFFGAISPRGWHMISNILNTLPEEKIKDLSVLQLLFSSMMEDKWIKRIHRITHSEMSDVPHEDIIMKLHKDPILRKKIQLLLEIGAQDQLSNIVDNIKKIIQEHDLLRMMRQGWFNLAAFESFLKLLPGDYREQLQIAFARNPHALKILGINISNIKKLEDQFKSTFRKKENLHHVLSVLFALCNTPDLLENLLGKPIVRKEIERLIAYMPDEIAESYEHIMKSVPHLKEA